MNIKIVTVIGATGTMGANVAGIFASFGNAKVYCIGRDIEKVKKTIPRIANSVRAESIEKNLVPADFSMLEDCVRESDLVFESVAENIDIKKDVASRVSKALKKDAIACTGTSGLSITTLAECYEEELRSHFFGVHMFNPPYSMTLCELTPTKYSDKELENKLKKYLKDTLYRTVVPVSDTPAFLGNRIGFQFINEALQYAEKYRDNGGIDYIDAILGPFTGRSMPPLVTADFVGLDVHKAIVDNIYQTTKDYAKETFRFPDFASQLVKEGKLGRKAKEGLYKTIKYDSGIKRLAVYDLNTNQYRDKIDYVFPFSDKMISFIHEGDYTKALEQLVSNKSQEARICLSFLLKYIIYSLSTAKEVGDSVEAADDVMATGFNWCPPLALNEALASVCNVKDAVNETIGKEAADMYEKLAKDLPKSKYDYRVYFKSKR